MKIIFPTPAICSRGSKWPIHWCKRGHGSTLSGFPMDGLGAKQRAPRSDADSILEPGLLQSARYL